MRLNKLDLNLLVVLDALLREKHITRAAESLHLSQSATSGALGRLREYFSDPLLVRAGTKMELTPLAASLQEPIRQILQDIQTAVEVRPDFDPSTSQRVFRFMMSGFVSMVFGPELVRRVAREAPHIHLEFKNPKLFPEEDLSLGKIDFLIMPLEWSGEVKGCHSNVLIEDGLVCLGWEGNERLHQELSLADFASMGHVTVSLSENREPLVQRLLREQYGLDLNQQITTGNFGAIPAYLIGTQRVCPMHTHLARHWADIYPLTWVPLPVQLPPFHWNIFWHKSRVHDPAVQWMLELSMKIGRELFLPAE